MLEQCLNWITSLELQGNKKFMVFSYDFESFAILTAFGYGDHVSFFPSVTSTNKTSHFSKTTLTVKSKEYFRLLSKKLALLLHLLDHFQVNILNSDVDVVFLNPSVLEYIQYEFRFSKMVGMFENFLQENSVVSTFAKPLVF